MKKKNTFWTTLALAAMLCMTAGADTNDYCQVAGPYCLEFDGVDDYVDLGNGPSLQVTGNFTVAAWVKLDAGNSGKQMGIVSKLDFNAERGFALLRYSNNRFMLFRGNGSNIYGAFGNFVATDTEWHHVAAMLTDTHSRMFVDGNSDMTQSRRSVVDSGGPATIGRLANDVTSSLFDGHIDDVRIYNRDLSQSEVQTAMTSLPTGTDPTLVGYWNLNEGSGLWAADGSGYNNLGQLASTTASAGPSWTSTSAWCFAPPTQVSIAGRVLVFPSGDGLQGVTMTIDGGAGSDTTDASGQYSLTVPYGWSGRITPSKPGYTFSPTHRDYVSLTANSLNELYTATPAISTYYVDALFGNDSNSGASSVQAFRTIQRGLNAAISGDTVIVLDGTYTGSGNRDLDFGGKSVMLRSENGAATTIIDCQNSGRAFHFHSQEDPNAVVDGFTLTKGNTYQGAAIYCQGASPTITRCLIVANVSSNGGAVFCTNKSEALISHCVIRDNSNSGGVRFDNSSAQLVNCLLVNNTASTGAGGAIRCDNNYQNPVIRNCTVVDNVSGSTGGGLWCRYSNVTLHNCIFWDNQAVSGGHQLALVSASLTVNYCDVQGDKTGVSNSGGSLVWGNGNLDLDPLFGDPGNDDYYLRSQRGRYYPKFDVWALDEETSPCIDAGDPLDSVGSEPKPNGDRINMGAFGGTEWASLTHADCQLVQDENDDGMLNYTDLFLLIERWLDVFAMSQP